MATHSSVLAWGIPGTGEPGGLPSMGSHRVGHDCSDLAAAAAVFFYKAIPYTQTLLVNLYCIAVTSVIKGLGYAVFTFSMMIFLNTENQMLTSATPGLSMHLCHQMQGLCDPT